MGSCAMRSLTRCKREQRTAQIWEQTELEQDKPGRKVCPQRCIFPPPLLANRRHLVTTDDHADATTRKNEIRHFFFIMYLRDHELYAEELQMHSDSASHINNLINFKSIKRLISLHPVTSDMPFGLCRARGLLDSFWKRAPPSPFPPPPSLFFMISEISDTKNAVLFYRQDILFCCVFLWNNVNFCNVFIN